MRKILLSLIFIVGITHFASAQGKYYIENVGSYTVDNYFFRQLTEHINKQPYELRPFLIDVYNDLKSGKTISYDPLSNMIMGCSFSGTFKPKELERKRKRWRKHPSVLFNPKYNNLCRAIATLREFEPQQTTKYW